MSKHNVETRSGDPAVVESVECPRCHAPAGSPCTVADSFSTFLKAQGLPVFHLPRKRAAEEAAVSAKIKANMASPAPSWNSEEMNEQESIFKRWNAHRADCLKCRAACTGPFAEQREADFCEDGLVLRAGAVGGLHE